MATWQPKNIMLAEKDQQNPFCIIDFGSAIEKGALCSVWPSADLYMPVYAHVYLINSAWYWPLTDLHKHASAYVYVVNNVLLAVPTSWARARHL